MKTNNYIRSLFITLIATFSVSLSVFADDAKGITGCEVEDPVVTVPANSYTMFSTVSNGKRYYLGVDTAAAKAGKDTIAAYDAPNYATMWIAGPLWSWNCTILDNKDYTRWVKSVWIEENCKEADGVTPRERYLTLGPGKSTYNSLILTNEDGATMWHTAKDVTVQSQHMFGYMYYYSEESGVEIYRYLSYDPVYGFSRLYEARPSESQRIAVWDRTTGDDVTATLDPSPYTFGLNQDANMVKVPITTRVYYYTNVDRFRRRYDQMDIYTKPYTVVSDQAALVDPAGEYRLSGYYEWASNPRTSNPYNGKSLMPFYNAGTSSWVDSTVLWVSDTNYELDEEANLWRDTLYAIGKSPFDVLRKPADGSAPTPGDYVDHVDWLRQHFTIKGRNYVDSMNVTRNTFHNAPFTTLSMSATPEDYVFPYTANDTIKGGTSIKDGSGNYISGYIDTAFVITVKYKEGNDVLYIDNSVAASTIGEERNLRINTRPCYRDTTWIPVIDPETGDTTDWDSHVELYDTLLVNAYLADGITSAIWDGEHDDRWIESVTLVGRDTIRVKVKQSSPSVLANRIAQIRYTYRYHHSSAEGDAPEASRIIWISQKSYTADDAELYAFHHNDEDAGGVQGVHERKDIVYAIPGQALPLHLHRDYWGYYRWFVYKEGANFDKDLAYGNNWRYVDYPKNHLNDDAKNGFMPINHTTDASSRGRWDIKKDVAGVGNELFATDHFITGKETDMPSVFYPESNSIRDMVACDVSAYYDVRTKTAAGTPMIGQNLTSLTEPTLSYRQVFDIRPAKEQADAMSHCRVNGAVGTDDKWMETHSILAPAGRAFTLQQKHPVQYGAEDAFEQVDLQYIYYFNPAASGNEDPNMGVKKEGVADTEASCYSYIGEKRKTGVARYRAHLMSASELLALPNGTEKTVFVVNPRRNGGYILGGTTTGNKVYWSDVLSGRTDAADLCSYIEDDILNSEDNYNNYKAKLTKTGSNTITLTSLSSGEKLYAHKWAFGIGSGVDWGTTSGQANNSEIQVSEHSCSANSRITGIDTALVKMAMSAEILWSYSGILTAWTSDRRWIWEKYSYDQPGLYLLGEGDDRAVEDINQGWCFYEIIEPDEADHEEHPIWEYSADGANWTKVAEKGTSGLDYTMLSDGSLRIGAGVHPTPSGTTDPYVYYRLRTEHFNIAQFGVWFTNPTTDGPSASAILSEDSIYNHYEILYTLGNELFPAPNTTSEKAFYHRMPWSFSELAYHYPVGDGENEIPGNLRVYSNFLPERGEYAYINKFVEPGNPGNVVESMAGAEHGYMMCINVSQRPVTIFDFEYPMIPCADQNIYLTVNLCNPVNNAYRPQITADLEGTRDGGRTWEPIYRYKTGEIPYNASQRWYQLVLPINQTYLAGYERFRCVATMPGSMTEKSYVLIDRMRFIAKERPVAVFQNKASCLASEAGGDVDVIARIDYQNTSYPTGTLVAFQYQKKVDGEFVPLKTVAEGALADTAVTYINESSAGPLYDVNDKSCGSIRIPAKAYTPTAPGDTITTVDHVSDYIKSYVNEGADALHAYYVMYLSEQVRASVGDTFRVAMTGFTAGNAPNFSNASCATERIIVVHNPVELHVSGYDGIWPNLTREKLNGSDAAHTLRPANATYTVTAVVGDGFLPKSAKSGSGTCRFDVVRTMDDDRGYEGDAWFEKRFGVTRQQFREIMTIFRYDDEANPMRLETNWNNVRPEYFQYSGRSKAQADSIYNTLNRLIVDSAFIEIGKSSYDIYLGDNNNAYVVLWPIPATGQYEDATTHDIKPVSVCSTPRWFEIHSGESTASLRFGFDNMFAGDYYILPIIRASSTDANSTIKVRISEITHDETTVAVMGWDATTLVETNDTAWHSAAFAYRHDKDVRGATPPVALSDYYNKGDEVTYTRIAGLEGDYRLKGGYWYKFRVPYYAAGVGATFTETTPIGHSEFVVAVAPDTVRWAPSHPDAANYWNDDNNWQPVMTKTPADGFKARVPMNHTKVIIPQVGEGLLPIVADLVVEQKDTLHYGYAKNTCEQILFKPRSTMLGQERLEYEKAFVDVLLKTDNWQTFSPALKHICSGDMYVPFDTEKYNKANPATGASTDTVEFAPKSFPLGNAGGLSYNPRKYPFAFYQGFYNSTVRLAYNNTDEEGNPIAYTTQSSKNEVDWVKTNLIDTIYRPGHATVINSYDAYNVENREIVVCLPKPDNTYYSYGKNGASYQAGGSYTMKQENGTARPAFDELEHNLAYDKTALTDAGGVGITYTLRNETESEFFFFGNPTMALVDVYQLCLDNADVLEHTGGTYKFTAYQLIDGTSNSYTVKEITAKGQYFIAPQRAVGLVANSTCKASKTLPVTLKPSALVAITGSGIIVSHEDVKDDAPVRRLMARHEDAQTTKRLYITAANETDAGVKKAYLTLGEQTDASRGFVKGEDALSLSSGKHYYNSGAFSTPISLYTIADNEALMLDIRDTLNRVPVVFSTIDVKFDINNYTLLTFSMTGNWDKPLYLYDAVSNDSVLIRNGLQIAIETPLNDQIRYFINGSKRVTSEENQQGTATGIEEVNDQLPNTNNQSGTVIYDVLGRKIMTLNEYDLISNIHLPTGVYIIQRGSNTERMVIR